MFCVAFPLWSLQSGTVSFVLLYDWLPRRNVYSEKQHSSWICCPGGKIALLSHNEDPNATLYASVSWAMWLFYFLVIASKFIHEKHFFIHITSFYQSKMSGVLFSSNAHEAQGQHLVTFKPNGLVIGPNNMALINGSPGLHLVVTWEGAWGYQWLYFTCRTYTVDPSYFFKLSIAIFLSILKIEWTFL